jgi:hypothetical protein
MSAAVLLADHQLLKLGTGPMARIALLAPLGAVAYVGSLHLLWLASGRCAGAEAELLGLLRGAIARVRKKSVSPVVSTGVS